MIPIHLPWKFIICFNYKGQEIQVLTEDWEREGAIDEARVAVEAYIRAKLEVDPRTDFPSFSIYNANGEEIGGG